MEYSVPRRHVADALNGIRAVIDEATCFIGFPVEVRFTAADDIPLSTASGRESAYLAVHVAKGMDYETYFRGVEDRDERVSTVDRTGASSTSRPPTC